MALGLSWPTGCACNFNSEKNILKLCGGHKNFEKYISTKFKFWTPQRQTCGPKPTLLRILTAH